MDDGVDSSLFSSMFCLERVNLHSSLAQERKTGAVDCLPFLCSVKLYHACSFGVVTPLNSPNLPPVPTNHVAKALLTSSVGRQARATFSCHHLLHGRTAYPFGPSTFVGLLLSTLVRVAVSLPRPSQLAEKRSSSGEVTIQAGIQADDTIPADDLAVRTVQAYLACPHRHRRWAAGRCFRI